MATLLVLILISTLWTPRATPYQLDSDAKNFAESLQDFLDKSLKHNEMQAHLDKLSFKQERLDGKAMLDSLVDNFAKIFAKRITSVKRLRDAVQKSYSDIALGNSRCCDFSDTVQYDPRFKVSVSYDRACDFISTNAPYYSIRVDDAFRKTSIRNLKENPSMLWQYFGSEEGVTSVYPAMPACTCGQYDCLSRPWYTQVTERKPKQVVIIVDSGESMGASYWGTKPMVVATEAARLLIEALNPYDEFVLLLSTEEALIDSESKVNGNKCFLSRFSLATPTNKKNAIRFLDSATPLGDTSYFRSLDEAFHFLQTSYEKGNRKNYADVERIIHLISDGISYDAQYLLMEEIYNWNRDLNNSVKILTYGIGNGDMTILNDIANFNPDRFKGEDVIRINEDRKLKEHIAACHRYFAAAEDRLSEPKWIVPYLDKWGLGNMLTLSLPVYINKDLIGVVAIDSPLEELFTKSTSFKPNELSYSFIINDEGLVINHPLLQYTEGNQMTFLPITTFERDAEFLKVLESMLKGEAGRGSFISTNYQSIGNSKKYGVKSVHLVSTYYWRSIPNTPFSVCVVCIGETQRVPMPQAPLPRGSVLYNRFDLVRPTKPCRHFHSYASMDKSVVFLASRAFSDPNHYVDHEFTRSDIESIVSYLEGDGPNVHKIKEEVRDVVAVSNRVQYFWASADDASEVKNNVLWRYLATRNGVFRILPAVQIADEFDATARPWFEHTLARRNKGTTITPPYKDYASGIPVVTIGQVLYKGSWTGIHFPGTDEIFGVMGVDLQVSYFTNLFLQWFPSCQYSDVYRCYLIDKAGYILAGNNINERKWGNAKHRVEYDEHIIEFEPEIASVLIRDNVLQKTNCSNVETGMFHQTYSIPDSQTVYWGSFHANADESFEFELHPVSGTNAFVILRILTEFETSAAVLVCPCTEEVCAMSSRDKGSCECPCSEVNTFYDSCRNKYSTSSNTPPPCIPPRQIPEPEIRSLADLSSLPKCYNTSFVNLEPAPKAPLTASQMALAFGVGVCVALSLIYCRRRRKATANLQGRKPKKKNKLGSGLSKQSKSDQTFKIRFGLSFSAKRNREFLRKTKSDSKFSPGGNKQLSAETLQKLLKKLPFDHHHHQTEESMQCPPWTSFTNPINSHRKIAGRSQGFQENVDVATFTHPTYIRKAKSDKDVYKLRNQLTNASLDLSLQHHTYQGLPLQMKNGPSTEMLRDFLKQRKTEDGFPTLPPQEFLKKLRQVKTDSDIPNKFDTGTTPSVNELLRNLENMGRKPWRPVTKSKQAPLTGWQRRTTIPTYSAYRNQENFKVQKEATVNGVGTSFQKNIKTPNNFTKSLLRQKLPNEKSQPTLLRKEQNMTGRVKPVNNRGSLLERSDWKLSNPARHADADFTLSKNMTFADNKLKNDFHRNCTETQQTYRDRPMINRERGKEIKKTITESTKELLKKVNQPKQQQNGEVDPRKALPRKIKLTTTDPRISQRSDKELLNTLKKMKTQPHLTNDRDHALTSHQLAMDLLKKKVEKKKKPQIAADNSLSEILNKLKQTKTDEETSATELLKSVKKTNVDSNNSRHRNLARSGQLAKELLGKLKELNGKKEAELVQDSKSSLEERNINLNSDSIIVTDIMSPKLVNTDQNLSFQNLKDEPKQLRKTKTLPQMLPSLNDDFAKELIQVFNKKKEAFENNSTSSSPLKPLSIHQSSDKPIKSVENLSSDVQTKTGNSNHSESPLRFPMLPSGLLQDIQNYRRDSWAVSQTQSKMISKESQLSTSQVKKSECSKDQYLSSTRQLSPAKLTKDTYQKIINQPLDDKSNKDFHQSAESQLPKERSPKDLHQSSTSQSPEDRSHKDIHYNSTSQVSDYRSSKDLDQSSSSQLPEDRSSKDLYQSSTSQLPKDRSSKDLYQSSTSQLSEDKSPKDFYQSSTNQLPKDRLPKDLYNNSTSQLPEDRSLKDVYYSSTSQISEDRASKDVYQSSTSRLPEDRSPKGKSSTNELSKDSPSKDFYQSSTNQLPKDRSSEDLHHNFTSQLPDDRSLKDVYYSSTSRISEDRTPNDLYQSSTSQLPEDRSMKDLYQSTASQLPEDRSLKDVYYSSTSRISEDRTSNDLYQSSTSQLPEDRSMKDLYQSTASQLPEDRSLKDVYYSSTSQLSEDRTSNDLYQSSTSQLPKDRSLKDLYQSSTSQLPEDKSPKTLYQSSTSQLPEDRSLKEVYYSSTSQISEDKTSNDLYQSSTSQLSKERLLKDLHESSTNQLPEDRSLKDVYYSSTSQISEDKTLNDLYQSSTSQLPNERVLKDLYQSSTSQLPEDRSLKDVYYSSTSQIPEDKASNDLYQSAASYSPTNTSSEITNKRNRSVVDKFYEDLYHNSISQSTRNQSSKNHFPKDLFESYMKQSPKNSISNDFSRNTAPEIQGEQFSKQPHYTVKEKLSSNAFPSKFNKTSENSSFSSVVNQYDQSFANHLPSTKSFKEAPFPKFQSDVPFQKVSKDATGQLRSNFPYQTSQSKPEPLRYGLSDNLPKLPLDLLQQIRQMREKKDFPPEVIYSSFSNKLDSHSESPSVASSLSLTNGQSGNQQKKNQQFGEVDLFKNRNKAPVISRQNMLLSDGSSIQSSSNEASASSINDKSSAYEVSSIPETVNITHLLVKPPRTLAKRINDENIANRGKQPDNLIHELSNKLANLASGSSVSNKTDSILTAVEIKPHLNLETQSDRGPLRHSKESFVTQSSPFLYEKEISSTDSTTQTDESFVFQSHGMSKSKSNLSNSTPSDQSFSTALSTLSNESYATVSGDINVPDQLYYCQTEDMLSVRHYYIKSYHSVDAVDLQQDELSLAQTHRRPTLAQVLKYTGKLDRIPPPPPKGIHPIDIVLTPINTTFTSMQTQPDENLSGVSDMKSRAKLANQESNTCRLSPIDRVQAFAEQSKRSTQSFSPSPLSSERLLHSTNKLDQSKSRHILEYDSINNGKMQEEFSREAFKMSSEKTKNDIAVIMQNSLLTFEGDQDKSSFDDHTTELKMPFSSQKDKSFVGEDTFVMLGAKTSLQSDISNMSASSHVSTEELQLKVPFQSLSTVSDYFAQKPYEKYASLSPSDYGPVFTDSSSSVGATTVKKLISPKQSQETFLENIYLQAASKESTLSASRNALPYLNFSQNGFDGLSRQGTDSSTRLVQTGSASYHKIPVSTSSKKLLKEDVLNQTRRESIHEGTNEKEKVSQYVRECVNDAVERAMIHVGKFQFSSSAKSNYPSQNNALSGKTYRSVLFEPFSSSQAVHGSFANVQELIRAEESEYLTNRNSRSAPNTLDTFMPDRLESDRLKKTKKQNTSYSHSTTAATVDDAEEIRKLERPHSIQYSHMPNIRVEIDVIDNNQASSTKIYYTDPSSQVNSLTEASQLTYLESLHRKSNDVTSPLPQQEIQSNIGISGADEEFDPSSSPEIYATPVASLESVVEAQFDAVYENVEDFESKSDIRSASETASHEEARLDKPLAAKGAGVKSENVLAKKRYRGQMQAETVSAPLLQKQADVQRENVFVEKQNNQPMQAETVSMPHFHKQSAVKSKNLSVNSHSDYAMKGKMLPTSLAHKHVGVKSENLLAKQRNGHPMQAETVSMPRVHKQSDIKSRNGLVDKQSSHQTHAKMVPTPLLLMQGGVKSENVLAKQRHSHLMQAETVSMPHLYKQPDIKSRNGLVDKQSSPQTQAKMVPTQLIHKQGGVKSENLLAKQRNGHLMQAETVSMPRLHTQSDVRSRNGLVDKQSGHQTQAKMVPTPLLHKQGGVKSENVLAKQRHSHLMQAETVSMPHLYKQPDIKSRNSLVDKQSSPQTQARMVPSQLIHKQGGVKSENVLAKQRNGHLMQAETVSMPHLYKQPDIQSRNGVVDKQSSPQTQAKMVPTSLIRKQGGVKSENILVKQRNGHLMPAETVSMPHLYKQSDVQTRNVSAHKQSSHLMQTGTAPTALLYMQGGVKSENVLAKQRNVLPMQAETVSMPHLHQQPDVAENRKSARQLVIHAFSSSQGSESSVTSNQLQGGSLVQTLPSQTEDRDFNGFNYSDPSFSNVNVNHPKTVYSGLTIDGSPVQSNESLTRKHEQKFDTFSQAYSSILNLSDASYLGLQPTVQSEMHFPVTQEHQKRFTKSETMFPAQQRSQHPSYRQSDTGMANVTYTVMPSDQDEDDLRKFQHNLSLKMKTSSETKQVQIGPKELIGKDFSQLIEREENLSKESSSGPDGQTSIKSVKSVRFNEKDLEPKNLSEPGFKSPKQMDEMPTKPNKRNVSQSSKDFTNFSKAKQSEFDPFFSFQYASSELYLNVPDKGNPENLNNLSTTNRNDSGKSSTSPEAGTSRGEIVNEQKRKDSLTTEVETRDTDEEKSFRNNEEQPTDEYAKKLKKILLDQPFDQVKLRHVELEKTRSQAQDRLKIKSLSNTKNQHDTF